LIQSAVRKGTLAFELAFLPLAMLPSRVTRLIVKYRDPAESRSATHNEPPSVSALDRISTFAGQPVVPERAMSGGAYVVRLFQSLTVLHDLLAFLGLRPKIGSVDLFFGLG
jgi:hypothetical protein